MTRTYEYILSGTFSVRREYEVEIDEDGHSDTEGISVRSDIREALMDAGFSVQYIDENYGEHNPV